MADKAISLSRVNKKLGNREVLKNVSFDVEMGNIFGYLGPNGAGKTTSIRIILGLLHPDRGSVSILGRDVSVDATRKRIGFVLESDGLYENLSAQDNLAYYAKIYDVSHPETRMGNVLSQVRLQDRARDKVGTYSKGMRQRLALARAMLHNPDVFILDEPTAGVDPTGQIEVRQTVQEMASRQGKTIFFSSHNLDEVQRICNRIALVDRGEIKLYGVLDELQRDMSHGEIIIETAAQLPEAILSELSGLSGVTVIGNHGLQVTLRIAKGSVETSDIISLLTRRDIKIEQVKRKEASLEEIYTSILKEVESR
jgi:ABC-2 type transport system ATP-binding protein